MAGTLPGSEESTVSKKSALMGLYSTEDEG